MSQQINLLSPGFRKKHFSFTSARAMAYGVGIAVTLTAITGVVENYRLRGVEAEAARVARAFKDAAAGQENAASSQVAPKPDAELELKVRKLDVQLKSRQEVVDALRGGLVGSSEGFSEYMRAFSRQSLDGVWLTGFDVAAGGEALSIAGRALTAELVPVYLQRLKREIPIQGRQFTSMVINQSPAAVSAASGAPTGPVVKEAGVRPPLSYVEFLVSSADPAEGKRATVAQRKVSPAVPERARVGAAGMPKEDR